MVSAIVPAVRPWKEPLNTITFCRPVAARAILTAFSRASAPELAKKNESIEAGTIWRSSSINSSIGLWMTIFAWAWMKLPACARMASTTLGWQ